MVEIRLENLAKSFGDTVAVCEVSLLIKKGELFFLLGPSGCGKTTLLRLVAGFADADEGGIYFDGRRMNDVPPHKRNTGMVFQNYALWPHMTVAGNVEYGLELRAVGRARRKEKVKEALQLVRLEGYQERSPNELSGGEQQRVALARALVIEPDAMLLDEPLSNLDAKLRLEMRQEIKRIHRQTGITTIYVTHDQKEALSMAERIAVMDVGKIRQVGTPVELYTRPRDRFVAEFIGQTNLIEGVIEGKPSPSEAAVKTRLGTIKSSRADASFSSGQKVIAAIRPEAIRITSSPPPEHNALPVVVESSLYLGELVQYTLTAPDQTELKAFELGGDHTPLAPGTRTHASFHPEDVVILPGSG